MPGRKALTIAWVRRGNRRTHAAFFFLRQRPSRLRRCLGQPRPNCFFRPIKNQARCRDGACPVFYFGRFGCAGVWGNHAQIVFLGQSKTKRVVETGLAPSSTLAEPAAPVFWPTTPKLFFRPIKNQARCRYGACPVFYFGRFGCAGVLANHAQVVFFRPIKNQAPSLQLRAVVGWHIPFRLVPLCVSFPPCWALLPYRSILPC